MYVCVCNQLYVSYIVSCCVANVRCSGKKQEKRRMRLSILKCGFFDVCFVLCHNTDERTT